MEDALISPAGFMILSGAGLVEASAKETIKVHKTETTDEVAVDEAGVVSIITKEKPYVGNKKENLIYVMLLEDGEPITEPYIPDIAAADAIEAVKYDSAEGAWVTAAEEEHPEGYRFKLKATDAIAADAATGFPGFETGSVVLVDFYTEESSGVQQIDITPDKFGGNYYLEASTLFRNQSGVDMPAEFIIPNCKIQSNFTFTMSSSGDPSTFTFTLDAFPDYTRFNKTKKVLAAVQIIQTAGTADVERIGTYHNYGEYEDRFNKEQASFFRDEL